MPDLRDGSMAGINGPMPPGSALHPGQAEIYALVPADWKNMPRLEVPEMILRALKDRGIVETRWRNLAVRQWRRTP